MFCHLRSGLPVGLFPQVLLPKFVYILIYQLNSAKWESVGFFCNSHNNLSAPYFFKFCITVGEPLRWTFYRVGVKIIKITQICIVLNLAFDLITFCLLQTEGCVPVQFYSKRQYSTEVDYSTRINCHCYLYTRLIEDSDRNTFCCYVMLTFRVFPIISEKKLCKLYTYSETIIRLSHGKEVCIFSKKLASNWRKVACRMNLCDSQMVVFTYSWEIECPLQWRTYYKR